MKIIFLVGLLQLLSVFEVTSQIEILPERIVYISINEPFSIFLRLLTSADITVIWAYKYEGVEYILGDGRFSGIFTMTEDRGPIVDGNEWRNFTLTGIFQTSGRELIICNVSILNITTEHHSLVIVSAPTSTISSTPDPDIKKNPPKPSAFVLKSPTQGDIKLAWKVFPHRGPHCLTYFNISYKAWDESSQDASSLEWIYSASYILNIDDGTAGDYSYTHYPLPIGTTIKFRIESYCSLNHETKYKVSDEIVVQRHVAPLIYDLLESRSVSEGQDITIGCNAYGYPTPQFNWTTADSTKTISTSNTLRFESVSVSDEGVYTCIAYNSPNGTLLSNERHFTLNVNVNPTIRPSTSFCALVTLNDCSPFLNSTPGYYSMSSDLDNKAYALKSLLLSLTSSNELNPCYRAGMTYLCNNLFRPCDPAETPMRIVSQYDDYCEKDCLDFWYSNCKESWDEFSVTDLFRSFNWLRECTDITSTPETCTPLGIKSILSLEPRTTSEGVTDTSQPTELSTLPLIIGVVIIFIVIVVIFIGIIFLCVFYYRQINKPQLCSSKFTESKVAENQFYLPYNNRTTMADRKEFPRSAVRFLRKLGQGQFGSVDLAEASNILPGEKMTLVAVKSLHEGATVKNKRDFELEAESMVQFEHPNILQLLGVSFKDKSAPRCLIFEYMEKGDLNNYLRGCASSYIKRYNNVPCPARSRTESQLSDDPPVLSVNDLVNISSQIASGMHYLSVRSFVHRDLATRNCLVGKNLVVKIGDFGMCKDVYKSDYYRNGKEALLPIKWMAPEAILYSKATIQTDIWSFGVLMWEVFSFAMQPWYGYTNEEVIEKVKGGEILSKPDNCPQLTYSLMLECWDMDPVKRISFESILKRLASWRVSSTESTSLPDVTVDVSDPFEDVCTS